jgi:hypothetical protein
MHSCIGAWVMCPIDYFAFSTTIGDYGSAYAIIRHVLTTRREEAMILACKVQQSATCSIKKNEGKRRVLGLAVIALFVM